jgi:hypothetical protein
MGTLEQSLTDRRASREGVRSCTLAKVETRTVVLSLWQSEKWILPWSQFVSARFIGDEGGKLLELSFAGVRVLITGENLRGLVDPLAAFRISALCDLPAQYRLHCGQGEPFISRLEVLAEQRGMPLDRIY